VFAFRHSDITAGRLAIFGGNRILPKLTGIGLGAESCVWISFRKPEPKPFISEAL
jgi:hypothetical protein